VTYYKRRSGVCVKYYVEDKAVISYRLSLGPVTADLLRERKAITIPAQWKSNSNGKKAYF
jgi:hypothetical protein